MGKEGVHTSRYNSQVLREEVIQMRIMLLLAVFAALFSLLLVAPAHAWMGWNSGWGSSWSNTWSGWNTWNAWAPARVSTFSSSLQPVNFHNQWVTFSRVTPTGTFSNINRVRFAQPTHFGFFNPGFVAW